jgi:beta-1,4-mannosyl-glycoprotein beta-1,4-N-acetylglucosaminyltransferase|tara:strand:- start:1041 stop:1856 length:816 start_codon:yes stop_codon:yes gene_type:complete
MKLIDCFMYFDDNLVLDIRLNTLNKYVDKFVIAEATLDHAGNSKKLNFDIKNFVKFKDKINYIVVEDIPKNVENFKKNWHPAHMRDQFQRNALERGYKNFNEEDLIMISDVDEIPNPSKISEFQIQNKYACFIQKNFQAKINRLNITEEKWPGTKICQKKYLRSPQWLRNIKTKKKKIWQFYKEKEPQIILDGGWHFSFLKDYNLIQKKIKSFAHQEFNKENFTDVRQIEERINSGNDIFERNYKYKKIDLDDQFPEYILKNKLKFKEWIL